MTGWVARAGAWIARKTPTREDFERIGWLRPIAHLVLRPELWRFTRRSVPRGVALGWLVGVLVPVAQTVVAALLAFSARANVPVAAVTTLVTNPLTTPPIWYAAYRIGGWALHVDAQTDSRPVQDVMNSSIGDMLRWLVSDAAPALALGLFIIAVVGATLAYLVSGFVWRWWIAHKWRRRRAHRRARSIEGA